MAIKEKEIFVDIGNGKKKRVVISYDTEEHKAAQALLEKLHSNPGIKPQDLFTEEEATALLDYCFSLGAKEETPQKKEIENIAEDLLALAPSNYRFNKMQEMNNMIEAVFGNPNNDFFAALTKGIDDQEAKLIVALKEIQAETEEELRKTTEQIGSLFKNDSYWVTLSKITADLKALSDKILAADPLMAAFYDEVLKMRGEEEWAGVDLSYFTFDMPQEADENGQPIPTRHNIAIGEAYRRAERRVIEAKAAERRQQPDLFEDLEAQEDKALTEITYSGTKQLTHQTQVVSKLQNALSMTPIVGAGEVPIRMWGRDKALTSKISVSLPEDSKVKGVEKLTVYEWEVSNALYTLWANGYRCFTLEKLYQAIVMDETIKPTKDKKEELKKILEKFSFLKISIDASEEIQKYTKDPKASYTRNDNYFHLRSEVASVYGNENLVYYFVGNEAPILLDHATRTKRVVSFSKRLLNVRDSKGHLINNTDERSAITGHLLRRIRQMKDEKTGDLKAKQNRRIDFENLFKDLQITAANRNQAKRNKDNVFIVLDHFKREGFIDNYKIIKGGRGGAILGVDIYF